MTESNINFRYLFEGTFAHLVGLPLSDGAIINAYWCSDRIIFRSDKNRYDLPFCNLLNICIKSDVEIYNQCKLSENLDFIPYGPVGVALREKGKSKGNSQATQYLIFTYKGKYNGETKYVAFELNQYSMATANNMINYFLKMQQDMPNPSFSAKEKNNEPIESAEQSYQQPISIHPVRKKKKHRVLKAFIVILVLGLIGALIANVTNNKDEYNKQREQIQTEFDSLVDTSLSNALSKTKEMGYTATYYYDNGKNNHNDYTYIVKSNISKDKKRLKEYVITKYDNLDIENKTVDLYINTKKEVERQKQADELENKLGHINACQAVEKYGEEQYPFGFKLHYIKGLQGYEMTGENNDTWRIKCSATITNAYGAKYKATCEAQVTGSNNAPKIISFDVY